MPKPVTDIKPPYRPMLLPAVVEYLESQITKDMRVFEYGSGASTVWFAGLVKEVKSVEHDQEWADEVTKALGKARRKSRVELVVVEDENDIAEQIKGDVMYDVIFIDCLDRQRNKAATISLEYLKVGGLFIVDDAHWPMLAEIRWLLNKKGWLKQEFIGHMRGRDGMAKPCSTIVYRRTR